MKTKSYSKTNIERFACRFGLVLGSRSNQRSATCDACPVLSGHAGKLRLCSCSKQLTQCSADSLTVQPVFYSTMTWPLMGPDNVVLSGTDASDWSRMTFLFSFTFSLSCASAINIKAVT